MRWWVAALVAVLLAWGAFLLSPYWAMLDIARAVQTGDGPRLATRLNTLGLRTAFARQIANEATAPAATSIAATDRQLAAAALTAAASPLLDAYLTPDGLSAILRSPILGSVLRRPETGASPGGNRTPAGFVRTLSTFVAASHWRGFRNVYFGLPPSVPIAARTRLQLRLSRFRWRLVAVELSQEERDRIADRVLGR